MDREETSERESGQPTVLALDNIALDLPVGQVGSRVLAAAVDYLLLVMLFVAWTIAAIFIVATIGLGGGWTFALILLGYFILEAGYFAALEISFGGRTLGKYLLGLRVVSRDGGTASRSGLLIRNLVRSVDIFAGVPMMAADEMARRLGDRLAGTLVVHNASGEPEFLLRRLPAGWGAEEAALAESYFRRLGDLEPERAQALAERIWRLIERVDPTFLTEAAAIEDPVWRLESAFGLGQADER